MDGAVFGGSSGSPVFVLNRGSYATTDGTINIKQRLFLVGMTAQMLNQDVDEPIRDYSERSIATYDLTNVERRPFVQKAQALDLGIAFNSPAIVETINVALAAAGLTLGEGEQKYSEQRGNSSCVSAPTARMATLIGERRIDPLPSGRAVASLGWFT